MSNVNPKVDKQKNNKYVYDANGNMIYVNTEEVKINGQTASKAEEKKMLWDEENRLGAIDNYLSGSGFGEAMVREYFKVGAGAVANSVPQEVK